MEVSPGLRFLISSVALCWLLVCLMLPDAAVIELCDCDVQVAPEPTTTVAATAIVASGMRILRLRLSVLDMLGPP